MADKDGVESRDVSLTTSAASTLGASSLGASPEARPPRDRASPLDFEKLSKMAGYLALVAYAIGLVAVNSYLYQLGVSEFDLFKPRFVTTGLLILLIIGMHQWARFLLGPQREAPFI